jgi:hypothetical protein
MIQIAYLAVAFIALLIVVCFIGYLVSRYEENRIIRESNGNPLSLPEPGVEPSWFYSEYPYEFCCPPLPPPKKNVENYAYGICQVPDISDEDPTLDMDDEANNRE